MFLIHNIIPAYQRGKNDGDDGYVRW